MGQKRREMCNKALRGEGLEVLSRWSGCLSALVLVTGRASLFVEVKDLFSDQVTRYPALNSLKAVALPAVRRLFGCGCTAESLKP